ncbi:MAG: tryptophan--tRNA ligase [Candidatus Omnitrophica bacterium]|nr:tryptophan--tRNA ligase [Candidatus Omnitrophota bacterium]
MKRRVLSGMRPTGKLHLGHLVGALNNWVELQDTYQCFYMVADWHALMSEYEKPKELEKCSYEVAKDFIASGLDPNRCTIFIQSHVPEHLELAMIFSDITPLAWVERCPTYKEQLRELKGRELTTYGFLGYPVLQAADIALYKANAVPVGIDQLPHLELTREIVRRFNALYKKPVFPEPEPILTKASKLLGLDNRKMSKSYGNFIALSDTPQEIERKVSQMVTDPERVYLKDKGHPAVCTVFNYFTNFGEDAVRKETCVLCEGAAIGCTECKKRLAKLLTAYLAPIREKRESLTDAKVKEILREGAKEARGFASQTMDEVKGLLSLAQ